MMSAEPTAVEVRRRLAAPPERVFAAFANADLVSRWLSPSPEIAVTVLALDFRPGGAYRLAYDVPGAQRVIVYGTYRAIEPPSTLVFTWRIEPPDEHAGIDSEVTVSLARQGTGTDLLIRHEKLTRAGAAPRHAEGWRGALDQLTTMLEEARSLP